jgi:uncharacterized membrane protein
MNAPTVVIFPDLEYASNALKAIQSMVSDFVVATKDLNGNLLLKETTTERNGGTIAGAFIGGLAGLPLGAVATVLGAAAGGLIGVSADLLNGADEGKLVKDVGRELEPGEAALILDMTQNNVADFESLMRAVGGTVLRKPSTPYAI